jgi:GNAT superfamily N-acetyltransferase
VFLGMVIIRNLLREDFAFASRLTDTMNWNLVEEDFEFMTDLEPKGCFLAIEDSVKVGLATTIAFKEIGWLGNVIVEKSHRRKGIGSQLVQHALSYLKGKDVKTTGIYAYMERVPFYNKIGFEHESDFVVIKGKVSSKIPQASFPNVKEEDIKKILNLDQECFGASRKKLLLSLLLNPDNVSLKYVVNEKILGFIIAKVYSGMAEIGPLVCLEENKHKVIELLIATLNKLQGLEVSMCLPKRELEILNALSKQGFMPDFQVARMFYGFPRTMEGIYAAESLERG